MPLILAAHAFCLLSLANPLIVNPLLALFQFIFLLLLLLSEGVN
uniref:Uncharacterized protein n=1 Tax=Picea glauca TaxID=3330 RepID=A0A101LZS2_PICGL|nr:hypothetical protein ABT39_MTgene5394 [Picea glauca]QHR91095.1 hypothetical protein Q903MT_gene5127 [Picea sitchensis]